MNCQVCFEDFEVNKENYIIDNNKITNKKIIKCPKCENIICSDCMIDGFKVNKSFKCLNSKCDYIYDIIFIYTNFNKEQIKKIEEVFENNFLNSEKQIIETTLNIKYRIARNINKIFGVILESCRYKDNIDIIEKVGEIVNDEKQERYKDLLKVMKEKELKNIIKEENKMINVLKDEVKNKLKTMFETITYYINNDTINVNNENIILNESNVNIIYEWYPELITIINKEEFLNTFRCFYTFMKYFFRNNKNGINPMVEVFLFISILYEKIDNTQNKYLNYLKHFINNKNNDNDNGYEIQGQYKTFYNGIFNNTEEPEYYIINDDMLFRDFEIFPNHRNNDWNIFNCIKLLFYYIDISSLNIKSMLKQQKFMTCLNKECNGDCYKYDEQIRCEKCNTIYCEKCWAVINPKFINVLDGTVIKKINNPNYHKKQHKCKDEDLKTVELIFDVKTTKHCPICNELISKNGGCNDMFCYNCWLNGKHTLLKWDTMQLTKTTTNEIFNHLMHANNQAQPRFNHPDAQRLRARGATIKDIISEYFTTSNYKNLLDTINNILSIQNINYDDNILLDERIKYMFNFTNEDIKLQTYYKYQPIDLNNINTLYKCNFIPNTNKLNEESMKIINMNLPQKQEFIENNFKQIIFNEYIKKYFSQYYSQLLSSLKDNIQDIIYTVKEDTFDNRQQPILYYIYKIKDLIDYFNSQISILKSYYPNLNYCDKIIFSY